VAVTPPDPRPPIQCSTGPFWAFELEHALDLVAEAGFEAIELMVTRDPKTQDPETVGRLARERALRVDSVHGPFLALTRTVWGLEPRTKIRRGIEFCQALGATTLVVHPPLLWERDYARWLARSSRSADPVVAVETMYPKWVAGRRVRAYRWVDPARLARACPAVVLDTSHVALAHADILAAFDALEPRLVHIHLSDNAGDNKDGHLALGEGILPLERLLAVTRRRGYRGTIALELSAARYAGRPKELVAMLQRSREHVSETLDRPPRGAKGPPRTKERR
jgi:sugar phosphate isomerase/epimerase